jgi:hypothetical protein
MNQTGQTGKTPHLIRQKIIKGDSIMKNFKFYAVLLVMLMVCEGAAFGSPKALFEAPQYNAGNISQGTMILHDFVVMNKGDQPLTLEAKDCGCGGVKAKTPGPIKPGKSDVIKVSIPTVNSRGNYKREIKIETNDPNSKEVVITITANINEILSIAPPYIDFGRPITGSKLTREFTITNNGKDNITILSVSVNPAGAALINPVLKKTVLKPGEMKKLELKLTPPNKSGYFQGQVIVSTDIRNLKEKRIFFGAEITAK